MPEATDKVIEKSAPKPLGVESALEQTERRGEVLAASSRILIAGTLLFAAWSAKSAGPASYPLVMLSLLYASISMLGLLAVFAKLFHPSLPYAFVMLDSAAIAGALTMQARMHGMGLSHEFSLPIFSLSFVVLIHAALRYRPSLIVLGAGTFASLLILLPMLPSHHVEMHEAGTNSNALAKAWQQGMELHDIGFLPLIFLGLAVVLLYYIVRRTRGLARLALLDGQRVAQLTRFFSPAVANQLVTEHYGEDSRGRRQKIAILFVDIRGFAQLSEHMPPEKVTDLLASFRDVVCQTVFDHGGTIDKFIGDAVLAVFGTPSSKIDDAKRATQAAFEISRAVRKWRDQRVEDGEPGALVGIGGHYGEVFVGVIVSGHILEHSVIGDSVNVAQRLERVTRDLDAEVVISEDLLEASNFDAEDLNLVRKKNTKVRGHDVPITIYHDRMPKNARLSSTKQ